MSNPVREYPAGLQDLLMHVSGYDADDAALQLARIALDWT